MDTTTTTCTESLRTQQGAERELGNYLLSPYAYYDSNPLDWWKVYKNNFPKVSLQCWHNVTSTFRPQAPPLRGFLVQVATLLLVEGHVWSRIMLTSLFFLPETSKVCHSMSKFFWPQQATCCPVVGQFFSCCLYECKVSKRVTDVPAPATGIFVVAHSFFLKFLLVCMNNKT